MRGDTEVRTSNVNTLELECSVRIFNSLEPTWTFYKHMASFFQCFSCLTKLILYLSNFDPERDSALSEREVNSIMEPGYTEDLDTLINRLQGIRSTLEDFEIHLRDNTD
jgi:hypothetical protein